MVRVVLLAFVQAFIIQSIAGQFVGSRLLAAPFALVNNVYEGILSAAAAIPYFGSEVLLEALSNNNAGDIPLPGSSRPFRVDDGPIYRDNILGKGFRPRNFEQSGSFAESYAVTETDQDW